MHNLKEKFCIFILYCTYILPVALFGITSNEDPFLYYQRHIQYKETGIYIEKDWVFIQTKVKIKNGRHADQYARAESMLIANNMLRQWAIEYTKSSRREECELDENGRYLRNLVLRYNPDWFFRGWNLKIPIQEFVPQKSFGYYILGKVVDLNQLIAAIPEHYSKPHSEIDWCKALPNLLSKMLQSNSCLDFIYDCNAIDLVMLLGGTNELDRTRCDSGYFEIEEKIKGFLLNSKMAQEMRKRKRSIEGPYVFTNWIEEVSNPTSSEHVSVFVKTNPPPNSFVSTNCINRIQTKEEMQLWGRATANKVVEKTENSDDALLISEITRTKVEKVRIVRRRSVRTCLCQAGFEDMFLSLGKQKKRSQNQTTMGKEAVDVYFAKTDMKAKEEAIVWALAENPYDKELWNLYGRCLQSQGDSIAALICYRISLNLDPLYEFALTNLSLIYAELGYGKLARGTAVVARGLSKNKWCISKLENILKEISK